MIFNAKHTYNVYWYIPRSLINGDDWAFQFRELVLPFSSAERAGGTGTLRTTCSTILETKENTWKETVSYIMICVYLKYVYVMLRKHILSVLWHMKIYYSYVPALKPCPSFCMSAFFSHTLSSALCVWFPQALKSSTPVWITDAEHFMAAFLTLQRQYVFFPIVIFLKGKTSNASIH